MAPNSSSPTKATTAAMDDGGGERLEGLDRKRLMELCKKNGIKCKGKNVDLVDKLKAFYISSSTTTPSSPISVDCNDAADAAIAESKEEEVEKKECQNKEKEQQSPLLKLSSSPLKRFRDSPLKCNPITLSLNDTPSKLGSPMRKRQSTQIGSSPAIRKSIPLPINIEPTVTMPVTQRPKYIAPHERVALMAKENLLKKQQRLKELQEKEQKEQLKPMATTTNTMATTSATTAKKTFNLQQSLERNNSSSTTSYTPHKGKLKPFSL